MTVKNVEIRKIQCEDRVIEYQLTRKPVKNINLRIKIGGQINVSADYYVSAACIDEFIIKNQEKIIAASEKYEKLEGYDETMPRQYVSGEKVRILGKILILKVIQGETESAAMDGDFLCLIVKKTESVKHKENMVKKWMKEFQMQIFQQICREIHQMFIRYEVGYPLVKIRTMKSRWGSCQPGRGIITLNSRLIEMPRSCIEYVVLHEFAHFIHPNHSKQFHNFVEDLMPDWRERREKLRQRSIISNT